MERPPNYNVKRYAVVFFCSLNILGYIIFAAIAQTIVDQIINHKYPVIKPTDIDTIRHAFAAMIIAGSVIGILFQLLGLIGAWRENVCMTTTYAVLQTLGSIFAFFNALTASIYWAGALWSILTTVVVILFLRDLRANRNSYPQQQSYYA